MKWQNNPWGKEKLQSVLERVEAKKARMSQMRPIPAIAMERLRESLMMEWTYHSNGIEGNTLTLQETRVILSDGITVGGKSLREHFETLNHHEAIQVIETMVNSKYRMKAKTFFTYMHWYCSALKKNLRVVIAMRAFALQGQISLLRMP